MVRRDVPELSAVDGYSSTCLRASWRRDRRETILVWVLTKYLQMYLRGRRCQRTYAKGAVR